MNILVRIVESMTLAVAAITAAVFNNLAIAVTPLSPAIYTGYAIADRLEAQIGWLGAGIVGFTFAMGLESAGYKSFSIAIQKAGWRSKMYPVAYVVLGVTVAVFLKPDLALVGTVMFLLPSLVYSAHAQTVVISNEKDDAQAEKEDAKEARKLDREAEREERRLEDEAKRALDLAKLEAQKAVKLAEINAQLSPPVKESSQKVSVSFQPSFPSDWRNLTDENKAQLSRMAEAEIAEAAGVTPKTARAWMARLGTIGDAE